jgi:uncharacterized membrane protein YgaE (UPF0421/DUF939 family)
MKYRIGYRTVKTAIGAMVSIMLAQFLGLDNFVSAGILTILCVKVTKKKSLRASLDRVLACLTGIIFAIFFFEVIAYHPIVIGLLLLFFIPTVVLFKASDGVASSSVIILHFYSAGHVTIDLVLNELGIVLIGVGIALLANLYMPSLDHKIEEYRNQIEMNFKSIFLEIVHYLRVGESDWDGKEITDTIKLLEEGKALSFRAMENHFIQTDDLNYSYFKMREKQFEIIERVMPIVTSISSTIEQGKMIADFIEELADHIHSGNTAIIYLEKLNTMSQIFEEMELPKTREEFEIRAGLLHFIKEMEQYLNIKSTFKGIKESIIANEKKGAVGN